MIKKILLILCIGCGCFSALLAQQPDTTAFVRLFSYVQNIQTFNWLCPQEKVYLHFDNTAYFQGDTIWFKAYLVNAADNKPTAKSNVLYVDLVSPEGHVIVTKKLKVENGQCHNFIALRQDTPRTGAAGTKLFASILRSGFYEVRAYTRVMLNWDSHGAFSRVFPVYTRPEREGDYKLLTMKERFRSLKDDIRPKRGSLKKLNISFFPEGGNLVEGIPSRVALK